MGKFDGILFVCDIDGTLMGDDKTVPLRNIKGIDYFIENGGVFTLASGRSPNSVRDVTRGQGAVRVNAPSILANGAMIYDTNGEVMLWAEEMNHTQAGEVLSYIIENFPHIGVTIFTKEGLCVLRRNDTTDRQMKRDPFAYFAKSLDEVPRPWYKSVLADEPEYLLELWRGLLDVSLIDGHGDLQFVFSEDIFLELMGRNTSKGKALERLIREDGRHFHTVYALGDNYNDKQLLEAAHVAAAPNTAVPEILRLADIVVCSNNDGAAGELIEHIEARL